MNLNYLLGSLIVINVSFTNAVLLPGVYETPIMERWMSTIHSTIHKHAHRSHKYDQFGYIGDIPNSAWMSDDNHVVENSEDSEEEEKVDHATFPQNQLFKPLGSKRDRTTSFSIINHFSLAVNSPQYSTLALDDLMKNVPCAKELAVQHAFDQTKLSKPVKVMWVPTTIWELFILSTGKISSGPVTDPVAYAPFINEMNKLFPWFFHLLTPNNAANLTPHSFILVITNYLKLIVKQLSEYSSNYDTRNTRELMSVPFRYELIAFGRCKLGPSCRSTIYMALEAELKARIDNKMTLFGQTDCINKLAGEEALRIKNAELSRLRKARSTNKKVAILPVIEESLIEDKRDSELSLASKAGSDQSLASKNEIPETRQPSIVEEGSGSDDEGYFNTSEDEYSDRSESDPDSPEFISRQKLVIHYSLENEPTYFAYSLFQGQASHQTTLGYFYKVTKLIRLNKGYMYVSLIDNEQLMNGLTDLVYLPPTPPHYSVYSDRNVIIAQIMVLVDEGLLPAAMRHGLEKATFNIQRSPAACVPINYLQQPDFIFNTIATNTWRCPPLIEHPETLLKDSRYFRSLAKYRRRGEVAERINDALVKDLLVMSSNTDLQHFDDGFSTTIE